MGKHLTLEPTSLAQWYALVEEARISSAIPLSDDLESYLVFLLMRFIKDPNMAKSILALDYLQNIKSSKRENNEALQIVGDKCLLYTGLFPGSITKRRVKISYYVELGQSSYHSLSSHHKNQLAPLFSNLCHHFVELMDVLHSLRELDKEAYILNPLDAAELWHKTHSKHALEILRKTTQGFILPGHLIDPNQKH